MPDKKDLCLSWTKTYRIFPVVFTSFSSWKFWQRIYIVNYYKVLHYTFRKCWTMPITACISELRNIFHLMLTFFMFHLIIYIAVHVQAVAGTEIITFIWELQGFNALEFVYEIISVESLDIFIIFMGGYKLASFIWKINVKQKSRSSARNSFLENNQGLKSKWNTCPQYFLFSCEFFPSFPGKSKWSRIFGNRRLTNNSIYTKVWIRGGARHHIN